MRRSSDLLAPISIRCPALRTVERRWSGAARTFIVWVCAAAVTSGDVGCKQHGVAGKDTLRMPR